jgi:imidazolonepropionase-like amidohydrolase
MTLLAGGFVWDADGRRRADVLNRDDKVAACGTDLDAAPAGDVVDCAGMTVLPGLIDVHVHGSVAGPAPSPVEPAAAAVRAVQNLRELAFSGVTTVRDLGGIANVMPAVAAGLAHAGSEAPSMVVANQIICATGGHGSEMGAGFEADGADGMRRAVRTQIKAGATVIKVAINAKRGVEVTDLELEAVVDEAHRHGLRVACHASTTDAVAVAVRAGVDTVEHGNGMTPADARAMAASGAVLVPTAYVFLELSRRLSEGELTGLPPALVQLLDGVLEQRIRDHASAMAAALAAGTRIALGTDSTRGMAATTAVDELTALVRYGLSRHDALVAATEGGAAALGLVDRGTLRPGSRADLLVVDGDPLAGFDCLRQPHRVVIGGRFLFGRC